MDSNTISNYFETYIKPYFPYATNRLYVTLINYISKYLVEGLYLDVPTLMRKIFEENKLPVEIYDQLLIAIGVHEEVIYKLTANDKEIFLKALSDFQRYKGSIKFFQKVPEAYNEKFNIYELWIDYNTEINDWVLKPYLIYSPNNQYEYDEIILYEEVYNEVPTLLVSPERLDVIKLNRDAIFPIKTNLILLQYNLDLDINTLKLLKISLFIHEYGNNIVTVYLTDKILNLTISEVYFFWYYLVSYVYNTHFEISSICNMVQFISDMDHPYTLQPASLNSIDMLENEFNKANSTHDIHNLYKDKIEEIYKTIYKSEEKITVQHMQQYITSVSADFLTYIETRIAESKKSKKSIIIEVLDEFYTSLISYKHTNATIINDPIFSKYFDLYLMSLPQLVIQPKKTTTYTLLYNFKPYHVELIDKSFQTITSKDKLDTVVALDKYETYFNFWKASALSVSDINEFNIIKGITSNVLLSSDFKISFEEIITSNEIVDDDVDVDVLTESVNTLNISDITQFNIDRSIISNIIISDYNKLDIIMIPNTDMIVSDNYENNFIFNNINALSVSDINSFEILNIITSNVSLNSLFETNIETIINDEKIINDNYDINIQFTPISDLIIDDICYSDIIHPVIINNDISDDKNINIIIEHIDTIPINDTFI